MSWFSDEHKNIYSQAFGALYDDVKNGTSSLMDTTGKLLSTGYEKIKETVNNIDDNNNTPCPTVDECVASDECEMTEIDMTEDTTDEYLLELEKMYPDVLIKLNKTYTNIIKIWIVENNNKLKQVRGKIESYPYINKIIHKWFIYEKRDEKINRGYKWYPTDEMYTAYRESSSRLNPMDNIVFRYGQQGYRPYYYHPLF